MASEEQLAANRSNAQLSTGPRTPEGKAAVARNAVTHGLTAGNIIPRTDDEKIEFEAIRSEAFSAYQPAGHTETLLVDRIVHARCSLHRVTRLLGELETGTTDDVLDPEYAKPLARLNRYYAMHERSEHRALQTLKGEQTNRGLKQTSLGLTSVAALPPLADIAKIHKALKLATRRTPPGMLRDTAGPADARFVEGIAKHGPFPSCPPSHGQKTSPSRR